MMTDDIEQAIPAEDMTTAALIDSLCTPATGLKANDFYDRAKAAWDHTRGTGPEFEFLPPDEQADLVRMVAIDTRERLDAYRLPPEGELRPVNHHSPASPPWPHGRDELLFWQRRLSDRFDELDAMAEPFRDENGTIGNRYLAGQLDTTGLLSMTLNSRMAPAETGIDETAHWGQEWSGKADQFRDAGGIRRADEDYWKGQVEAASMWARLAAMRQSLRVTPPEHWAYGGPALIDALAALPEPMVTVTDAEGGPGRLVVEPNSVVMVIAVSDTNSRESPVHALRAWTGLDAEDAEHLLRTGVDYGLVTLYGGDPHKAVLTGAGVTLYTRTVHRLRKAQEVNVDEDQDDGDGQAVTS